MSDKDLHYLKRTLEIARKNITNGSGPFGAIVVRKEEVLAESANCVVLLNDPTAHAEILAIREASAKVSSFDLSDCVLYASCEPCPMCMAAIYWAGIQKVVYASDRRDAAEAGFQDDHIYRELALDPARRKVTFLRELHEEGVKIFREWKSFDGKIPY
jgi:guanine deaminase